MLERAAGLLILFCLWSFAAAAGFEDVMFQSKNIDRFSLEGTHTIALTFDDGPGPGTEEILDLLKQNNIKATFFVIGQNAEKTKYDGLMKRIVAEGHILANHTYSHPNLDGKEYTDSPQKLIAEIQKTHDIIKKYLKPNSNLYFRAPYASWKSASADHLNFDSQHRTTALAQYVGPVMWDIGGSIVEENGIMTDAADWDCWNTKKWTPEVCGAGYQYAILQKDGGVVLSHSIYENTAEMWRVLIPQLKALGFKFVTLDQIPVMQNYLKQNVPEGTHEI